MSTAMDSRTAAHTLNKIADVLEAVGAQKFKSRAYRKAAKSILSLDSDDLAPLLSSGKLGRTPNVGPATLGVVRDLVETGESAYLRELSEGMPEGLTALVEAIQFARESQPQRLFIHAVISAAQLVEAVRRHPDVKRAEIAGEIRRRLEIIGSIEIAAECGGDPHEVARSLGGMAGVQTAEATADGTATLTFIDGERIVVHCATSDDFALVLFRATGNQQHASEVIFEAEAKGLRVEGNQLVGKNGGRIAVPDEATLYKAAGLQFVPPEMRESRGEIAAAKAGGLPTLIEHSDLRGVLHCHSDYSDGTATIEQMAKAARSRGWEYLGITDHSQAAHYAGGLKPDDVLRQHAEIDKLNSMLKDFRILKGIEADILRDGRIDYDEKLLERFDFVIGSIHARFKQTGAQITERVLRAMDDPHLTILAHPTGRLLLSRPAYDLDLDAVLAKAVENGVAVEVNADPHRLDLDWRYLHNAKLRGVMIEVGPDAHSPGGLDATELGIGMARKGWLEPGDVLNTGSAQSIIDFARKRLTA